MARLHNGINGPASGRVGDLIFSSRNGLSYVRKAPKPSSKKPSEKQQIQREKFRIVMNFLSPLKSLLNESPGRKNSKLSGLQTAIKQVLAEVIVGENQDLRINYKQACLLRGSLSSPNAETVYKAESNELHLSWQVNQHYNSYLNDELFALIYCHSLPQTWYEIRTGMLRAEQNGVIKLPVQLAGNEIYIWLAYHSEMMESYSDSVYIGQFFTKKPTDHGNS